MEIAENMRAILDRAEAESRDLNRKDEMRLAELEGAVTALDERLAKAVEKHGEPAPSGDARSLLSGYGEFQVPGEDRTARSTGDIRSAALDLIERRENMPQAARDFAARSIESDRDPTSKLARFVLVTGQEDYRSAITKVLTDPHGYREWTNAELEAFQRVQREARAMNIATGSQGGYLLPFELDPQVILANAGSVDPMREVSRVVLTAQNTYHGITSAGVTAEWKAESVEASDASPTFAQPPIECFQGSAFVPASYEQVDDTPDLPGTLGMLFADAKAQHEAQAFTLGTGTGQPKGVITAVSAVAGSVVVNSAGTAIARDDVVANQNALPARYRRNAVFMAALEIMNDCRGLPKGSGLTDSLVDDSQTPPRMLGWQLHENSHMDGTIDATANDYVLLSGDFRNYVIADRIGTRIELIPNLTGANGRPTGQRGWFLTWRTGADVIVPDAFRLTNFSA